MGYPNPDIEATDPDVKPSSTNPSLNSTSHTEDATHTAPRTTSTSTAARLRNPLAGLSESQVLHDVDVWVEEKGLTAYREEFQKGALIARTGQRDDGFEYVGRLSEEEKALLRHEITHRWDHPFMLYFLVVLCAGSAIVQGMDQTAVNGAQVSCGSEVREVEADVDSCFTLGSLILRMSGSRGCLMVGYSGY